MNINLNKIPPQPIPIGFDGEHNAENLIITLSDKLKGADYYVMLFSNNGNETISERLYASSDTVTISLPQSVMTMGLLKVQLVSFKGVEIIAKSPVISFNVGYSIDLTDTPIESDTSDILGDLNNLIDRINNLDDLVPDNGITSNKIADKAIITRHISDVLLEQIQSGGNAIKSYTEFPIDPKEGDTIILTERAVLPAIQYGWAEMDWRGIVNVSENERALSINTVEMPLALFVGIDFSKVPVFDNLDENLYGLAFFNAVTEELAFAIYGKMEEIADKNFLLFENENIKIAFLQPNTTFEGEFIIEQAGWYKVEEDEYENDVFIPISDVDDDVLELARISNTSIYDIFYYVKDGIYSQITDDVFFEFGQVFYVVVNSGIYTFKNNKWVDINYHGEIKRHIDIWQYRIYGGPYIPLNSESEGT